MKEATHRRCQYCGESFPANPLRPQQRFCSRAHKERHRAEQRRTQDPERVRARERDWAERNRDGIRARQRTSYQQNPKPFIARSRKARAEQKTYLDAVKLELGCIDCGYGHAGGDLPELLEFDHVRGEKRFSLGDGTVRARETLDAEIAKCDVRCVSCHRIRTLKATAHCG